MTIFDATGTENQVYTTANDGATWSGPALVGESTPTSSSSPGCPTAPTASCFWYGAHGSGPRHRPLRRLGRGGARPGPGVPVFSAPMQVSSVAGAYPPQYGAGDDFSWVIADQKDVDIGWGDARNLVVGAGVQTWFARIPLTTLEGGNA